MEMESLLREPNQERVKRTLFDQNLANKPLPRTTDLLASNESVKTNADSRRPPSSATSTTTKETVSYAMPLPLRVKWFDRGGRRRVVAMVIRDPTMASRDTRAQRDGAPRLSLSLSRFRPF